MHAFRKLYDVKLLNLLDIRYSVMTVFRVGETTPGVMRLVGTPAAGAPSTGLSLHPSIGNNARE